MPNNAIKNLNDKKLSPAVLYYFHYLKFIHKLINENIVMPYWLNISDIIEIANNKDITTDIQELSNKFSNFPNNRFLTIYSNNPHNLAGDILNNGYYVPMLSMQNKYFINGSHRIGSLISYNNNIKKIKKQFLCLSLNDQVDKKYNVDSFKGLSIDVIYNNGVKIVYPLNNKDIIHLVDSNGGMASNLSFDYNRKIDELQLNIRKIIPAPCLNNQDKFDDFISTPFTDEYLIDIEKYFGIYLPFDQTCKDPLISFY